MSIMAEETPVREGAQGGAPSSKPLKGKRTRMVIAGAVAAILLVILAAVLTVSVQPDMPAERGASYPYTTTYAVLIPEGKVIQIAGLPIITLTAGDEMILKIGDRSEKFVTGETRTISERRAEFRVLGLPVLSTNYLIEAMYRGRAGSNADFFLIIRTSGQVPSFLIERILPPEIQARPA